jgi:hypothetical protein
LPVLTLTGRGLAAGFPYDYNGQVDSHAYSVASFGDTWIVADAGMGVASGFLGATNLAIGKP